MCGEQEPSIFETFPTPGSPPRVRGTVDLLDGEDWYGRITPACAGNRSKKIHIIGGARDHPRVCGEQFMLLSLQKAVIGSPPRVRGTVQLDFAGLDGARITPACAGNRLKKARHFYILFCQIKRIHLV